MYRFSAPENRHIFELRLRFGQPVLHLAAARWCHSAKDMDAASEADLKRQKVSTSESAGGPWARLDDMLSSSQGISSAPSALESEMATYLSESLLPRSENPLHWWRSNAHRFPIMAEAARTYLAAPPTSVPSERVFSIAGDTLSDHRSRLLPERLILLKFNLKLLNVV